MKTAGKLYIGTSGIVVPVPQSQYPAQFQGRSRLSFYSSLLNSLEVNSSFYKNPGAATIEKWVSEVNPGFKFTFKIPKQISHAPELRFDQAYVDAFLEIINSAAEKSGCILVQLPPSLQAAQTQQLEKLLKRIRKNDRSNSWKIAVEFRHFSWYNDDTTKLLEGFNACMVIHDLPKSATPVHEQGNFFYLRFHGENGRYRGSYNDEVLSQYAKKIKKWINQGRTGYCYFNNTMGDAFANAEKLNHLVQT